MRVKTKRTSGFTIVELLIVIVVIGILATLSIVAYSGVQQKATTASLQSDLTNASQLLKMFQVDNSAYPLTINCAIADSPTNKCIKSSGGTAYQYSYSNANSPTFCLAAQNGTTTYSVSNDSTPVRGVCLTNLVTNGDFSAGTNGWNPGYGTLTAVSNTLSNIGNGGGYYSIAVQTCVGCAITGHKIYATMKQMVTNSNAGSIGVMIADSASNKNLPTIYSPAINNWYTNSGIVTLTGTGNIDLKPVQSYVDAATANAKIMKLQYVAAFDLTAIFGVGNEPTSTQMDTIMQQFPNNWFNGTALASM